LPAEILQPPANLLSSFTKRQLGPLAEAVVGSIELAPDRRVVVSPHLTDRATIEGGDYAEHAGGHVEYCTIGG
jgi:hypothetical protein